MKDVKKITKINSSTIYRWIAAGSFPAGRRLGANCVRWRASDIREWQSAHEDAELLADLTLARNNRLLLSAWKRWQQTKPYGFKERLERCIPLRLIVLEKIFGGKTTMKL